MQLSKRCSSEEAPKFLKPKRLPPTPDIPPGCCQPSPGVPGGPTRQGRRAGLPPIMSQSPPSIHLGSQRLVWEMLLLQPVPSGLTPGQWFLSHKPLFLSCSSGLMSPFFFLLFYYLHFEDSSKSPHFCFFCPLPLLLFLSANSIMDFICN